MAAVVSCPGVESRGAILPSAFSLALRASLFSTWQVRAACTKARVRARDFGAHP